MDHKPLSPAQHTTLNAIKALMAETKAAPTMQQVADRMGVSKTTVFEHVEALERKGWIVRDPDVHFRSIRLTGDACPVCGREHGAGE
jgi:DNA-binding MarR family transcriptional regulator